MLLLTLLSQAPAMDLALVGSSTPYPGLVIREVRASDPDTDVWAAQVDLCAEYVHVQATQAPSGLASTGSWAVEEGLQLASNGDFYKSSPTRVYGDAVGNGQPWPLDQTGRDPGYEWEWFYGNYGWLAFGHDGVAFTHSGWIKEHPDGFTLDLGWQNSTVLPEPPAATLALVSGFSELVVEGTPVTCSSPTASDCFEDRSDMRDRHPRTAMGLSQDLETLLLVTVDGRTSRSSGMYGAELAELMAWLGAWQAFNLDGGGSSQLWLDGSYINDYSGNNSGSGARSVANHWGVSFGPASGRPKRPGHCVSAPPCEVLPPEGGLLDDAGDCFQAFGDATYWRTEAAGHDGGLHWTNAFETEQASNWAWWRLFLEQAGEYQVDVYVDPAWGVYAASRYRVRADGAETDLRLDQGAASGWVSLGSWDFAAGGDQLVAVYDDSDGGVGSDQHVVADAIRLTRLDLVVDTGTDSGPGETGQPTDGQDSGQDSAPADAAPLGERVPIPEGGCAQSGTARRQGGAVWLWMLCALFRARAPGGSPGRGRGSRGR